MKTLVPEVRATSARLLTVSEAADLLRISKPTVYALLRRGALKSFVIGTRARRIPESELHRFIAQEMEVGA